MTKETIAHKGQFDLEIDKNRIVALSGKDRRMKGILTKRIHTLLNRDMREQGKSSLIKSFDIRTF